ncbi:MAG: SET domain-containing protein [Chloroflexi bacterium]|nr:SET domain-containing protein [Chloroflexota bacterium]
MADQVRTAYRSHEWIDPRIEIRASPIGGRGMFSCSFIRAGEIVVIWGGVVFTQAEVDAGNAAERSTVAIGEGRYLGSPVGQYDRERDDLGDFMNHSCDPNCWMQDEVTLVARRDIRPGEELTGDYVMWEADEAYVRPWECNCGSPLCRRTHTGRDWRLPELQARYQGHFSPFINARIKAASGSSQ